MVYKVIKYGLLGLFSFGLVYHFWPQFDRYCTGMMDAFTVMFLGAGLFITFMLFTLYDIMRYFKDKVRYDFVPLIIITLAISLSALLIEARNKNYWKETILHAELRHESFHQPWIELYDNSTFKISDRRPCYGCSYQGYYNIDNNILELKIENLAEFKEVFTFKYLISFEDSLLIPELSDFNPLEIDVMIINKLSTPRKQ